ncbi:MAG: MerR family transcriptional regulator [Microbacterium sp.]
MSTFTPAEAAARSGFSLDTLRYYEREGILPPVSRTAGGHRVFTEDDLGTLGFLRCLRDTGMPIERLRRYGQLCQDEGTLADRLALLEEHAVAVQAELDAILLQQARLAEKLAWYRGELATREATEDRRSLVSD